MKKILPAVMTGAMLLAATMPAYADTDTYSFKGHCTVCGDVKKGSSFPETAVLTDYTAGATFNLKNYVSFGGRFAGGLTADIFDGQLPATSGAGNFDASYTVGTDARGFFIFDIFETKADGSWFAESVNEADQIRFLYSGTDGVWTLTKSISQPVAPSIPEPDAFMMLIVGLGLVGFAARWRKPKTPPQPV